MAALQCGDTAMDSSYLGNGNGEPVLKESQSSSTDVMVVLVFRHELTDGTVQSRFDKELTGKVEKIKNGRKETTLSLDPNDTSVGDVKAFLLQEYGMRSVSTEESKDTYTASMIMMAGLKVVMDSESISDLIAKGNIKMLPSPMGDKYSLDYIFDHPDSALSSHDQQQKFVDSLCANLAIQQPSGLSHPAIQSATVATADIYPATRMPESSPHPETQLTSAPIYPNHLQTSLEKVAPESHLATGTPHEKDQETGRKKRGRSSMDKSNLMGTAEFKRLCDPDAKRSRPLVRSSMDKSNLMGTAEFKRLCDPDAKRSRALVPNNKPTVTHTGLHGNVVTGGTPHVFGNVVGSVNDGGSSSVLFPLSANLTPYPMPYPAIPLPNNHAIQTPTVPVLQSRRWAFSALEMNALTHLAAGHKKITVIFEEDDGSIQTVSVTNRP